LNILSILILVAFCEKKNVFNNLFVFRKLVVV